MSSTLSASHESHDKSPKGSSERAEITQLLVAWAKGDAAAGNQLFDRIYPELKKMVGHRLNLEKPGFELHTKEIIHEMYFKLVKQKNPWENRQHFFSVASQSIRRVIVDHVRFNQRKKRGGDAEKVSMDIEACASGFKTDWLALDEALTIFAKENPLGAKIAEMHYFAGFSGDEIAPILGISRSTANRHLRMMRAFLKDVLDSK